MEKTILNKLNSYDRQFYDPKLINAARGQYLTLDSYPLNGEKINNPNWLNTKYSNFSDIHLGQINYYYDQKLAKPFIPELFSFPHMFEKICYSDPMGTKKPHFLLLTKASPHLVYSPEGADPRSIPGIGYQNIPSDIKCENFHRDDLLSRQLWKRNQNYFLKIKI